MVDMFNDEYKVQSALFNFEEVGDKIQGTYVGKSMAKSKYSGFLEPLYELKTEEGELYTVWGKPIINQQMRHVKLGQIVGMKLIELRKSEKGNPSKIIQVYADPKLVDEEWLKDNPNANEQQEGVEIEEVDFGASKEDVPFESGQPPVGTVAPDKASRALELAKIKYQMTDDNDVKNRVMNETGLAWIEVNLDKIIEFLQKK